MWLCRISTLLSTLWEGTSLDLLLKYSSSDGFGWAWGDGQTSSWRCQPGRRAAHLNLRIRKEREAEFMCQWLGNEVGMFWCDYECIKKIRSENFFHDKWWVQLDMEQWVHTYRDPLVGLCWSLVVYSIKGFEKVWESEDWGRRSRLKEQLSFLWGVSWEDRYHSYISTVNVTPQSADGQLIVQRLEKGGGAC